jgi:hypothetical protein
VIRIKKRLFGRNRKELVRRIHQTNTNTELLAVCMGEMTTKISNSIGGCHLSSLKESHNHELVTPTMFDASIYTCMTLVQMCNDVHQFVTIFCFHTLPCFSISSPLLIQLLSSEEQMATASNFFPCQLIEFPVKYLGIPLSVTKLPRCALQPLLDRVADKLPTWKGRLMHRSGQLTLIKTIMMAVPVYTSISVGLPPWFLKTLHKIM